MADSHFNDPYAANNAVADRRQQDAQKFNQMVQMLAMANRASGQTMLGFALGKLLRSGFQRWYENYLDRGASKEANTYGKTHDGTPKTPDQQAAEKLRQQNAEQLFAPYHRSLMDVAMANTYNGGRTAQDDFQNQFMQQAIQGARKASTPEAQQFYADQKAHPEWFEGDYFVGWDPAAHEKFRAEHPDYMKTLAAKTAQTTTSPDATNSQPGVASTPATDVQKQQAVDWAMQGRKDYRQEAADALMGTQNGTAANASKWDDALKFASRINDPTYGTTPNLWGLGTYGHPFYETPKYMGK